MAEKQVILFLKDKREMQSDFVDAGEAQRLLEDEVFPKMGKHGAIKLPGVVAQAPEVVGAQLRNAPSFGIA
ncbi:MAG: hypothetical protein M0T77_05465 [Actinomycetota bacterium]|nr:hypothetical protein [Actinomycetota bacterium]